MAGTAMPVHLRCKEVEAFIASDVSNIRYRVEDAIPLKGRHHTSPFGRRKLVASGDEK